MMRVRLLSMLAVFVGLSAFAAEPVPLPVSYAGVVPCADCAGIAQTLTLRPDGLYRLRRTYLGKLGDPVSEAGRWRQLDARLELRHALGVNHLALDEHMNLHLLDQAGRPIRSTLNDTLRRVAQLDPVDEVLGWQGEVRYLADAASVTDCLTGLRWPLAMRADYRALERRYLELRRAPGAPLLMRFQGRLNVEPAMDGAVREQMVVERFDAAEPERRCPMPDGTTGADR